MIEQGCVHLGTKYIVFKSSVAAHDLSKSVETTYVYVVEQETLYQLSCDPNNITTVNALPVGGL